jgi:hypothetical protein
VKARKTVFLTPLIATVACEPFKSFPRQFNIADHAQLISDDDHDPQNTLDLHTRLQGILEILLRFDKISDGRGRRISKRG